ncbi:hypothetical protein ACTMS0_17335 [Micromonospora sp. H33]|uniref:hypothetical protein n=1 Tax=Micromonospora sp. H33 TaxID=3452215 RepID=UPI003F89A39A
MRKTNSPFLLWVVAENAGMRRRPTPSDLRPAIVQWTIRRNNPQVSGSTEGNAVRIGGVLTRGVGIPLHDVLRVLPLVSDVVRCGRLLVQAQGNWAVMTKPESRRQEEQALESGELYQDAEGRRTTDPGTGAAHADSEADRNVEHLERGEVGPGIPEQ